MELINENDAGDLTVHHFFVVVAHLCNDSVTLVTEFFLQLKAHT